MGEEMGTETSEEYEVGYKKPPKKNQFSTSNRPPRRRATPKKPKAKSAEEAFREAVFQEVSYTKDGKKVKLPFIYALMQSMIKSGFTASLSERLRLWREIAKSGVFEFEEVRDRINRNAKAHYAKLAEKYNELCDEMESVIESYREAADNYKTLLSNKWLYEFAYFKTHEKCTCGASEAGMKEGLELLEGVLADMKAEAKRSAAEEEKASQEADEALDQVESAENDIRSGMIDDD